MDLSNLPKAGKDFNLTLNKAGHKSFFSKLKRLRRKNSQYRNLSDDDIKKFINVIKPYEKKSIRRKGGLTSYQIRKAGRKLWKMKKAEGDFTKEDYLDEKKILKHYKRDGSNQSESESRTLEKREMAKKARMQSLARERRAEAEDSVGRGNGFVGVVGTAKASINQVKNARVSVFGGPGMKVYGSTNNIDPVNLKKVDEEEDEDQDNKKSNTFFSQFRRKKEVENDVNDSKQDDDIKPEVIDMMID